MYMLLRDGAIFDAMGRAMNDDALRCDAIWAMILVNDTIAYRVVVLAIVRTIQRRHFSAIISNISICVSLRD